MLEAEMEMAGAYNQGNGIPADFEQAYAYYMRAAEKGNIEAAYNLGMMLQAGVGTPTSLKEIGKMV